MRFILWLYYTIGPVQNHYEIKSIRDFKDRRSHLWWFRILANDTSGFIGDQLEIVPDEGSGGPPAGSGAF